MTTDTEILVQLALKEQACTLKELAEKLKTSTSLLSKWRKSESSLPFKMEVKLKALAKMGDMPVELVRWAGSVEQALKWENLMQHLAEDADNHAETGYNTSPLTEELDTLYCHTVSVLNDLGVSPPTEFPEELHFDDLGDEDEDFHEENDRIKANPYSALIADLYEALANVYGFYRAFVYDLVYDEDLCKIGDEWLEIEDCLIDLAACKIEIDKKFAPKAQDFKFKTLRNYKRWLINLKHMAIRKGIPLRAELLDLVHCPDGDLCDEADRESLGFNDCNLHPDIYMNELLVGMRTIHQVLPVIMKKLGIFDDFELDSSEFYLQTVKADS